MMPEAPAPAAPRDNRGWIALFIICFLLIGSGLSEYVKRPPPSQGTTVKDAERSIKMEANMRVLNPSSEATTSSDTLMGLDKNPSDEALRLRSAYRLMLEKTLPEKDEKAIAKSEFGKDLETLRSKEKPKPEVSEAIATRYENRKDLAGKMLYAVAEEKSGGEPRWSHFGNRARGLFLGVFGMVVVGAGLLGGLVLILQIMTWKDHRPKWRHPMPSLTEKGVDQLGITAALGIFGFFFGQFVGAVMLMATNLDDTLPALATPMAMFIAGLFVLFVVMARGWSVRDVTGPVSGLALPQGIAGWAVNLMFMLPALVVVLVLSRFLPAAEHPVEQLVGGGRSTLIGTMIAAVILAPIIEEFLFRGILLHALVNRFGSVFWGVVVTNFVFAAVHPTGVVAWPALFTVGLTASLLTLRTGSLVPAMILHCLHNLVAMSMLAMFA